MLFRVCFFLTFVPRIIVQLSSLRLRYAASQLVKRVFPLAVVHSQDCMVSKLALQVYAN